ncbi:unnamed protein product [Vitrella brassicaformis CCMP3155]|uniref:Uncharacterized protein n=1 Tax=Vitrella brassicaformis (strain CCMP3155) TaxID=1169540 RepID=A0A0G4EAG5_VITBC|nr:unnamed protein product [Vitrella brassicaformis CCMP3155]|eukprot:CEL92600.1 unnamed protein product [Vitrella brassicaformis CCMP3155]
MASSASPLSASTTANLTDRRHGVQVVRLHEHTDTDTDQQPFADGVNSCATSNVLCQDPEHVCYRLIYRKGRKHDKGIAKYLNRGKQLSGKLGGLFAPIKEFTFGVCVKNTDKDLDNWCPEAIRSSHFPPEMKGMEGRLQKRVCEVTEIAGCFTGRCEIQVPRDEQWGTLFLYNQVYKRLVDVWGWSEMKNTCKPEKCKLA